MWLHLYALLKPCRLYLKKLEYNGVDIPNLYVIMNGLKTAKLVLF
jgi:hypothetical protein